MIIILDAFPTSSVARRAGVRTTLSDQCAEWVRACEDAGHTILIPAIAYYEVLRELERRQAAAQIARLREFCLDPTRFIPVRTEQLHLAARLWGEARRAGKPTADPAAIDGDVLLAAQVLSLGLGDQDYVVATTNPSHLSQFVVCDLWTAIAP